MDPFERPVFREHPIGKKELLFGLGILLCCLGLCNFLFYGGLNLGFAIASSLCILCAAGYLLRSGRKLTFYPGAILALCLVIAASFARGDDIFVKFVMFCFLILGSSLGLCLLAGQQRRDPGKPGSLADGFATIFRLGFGQLAPTFRGLARSLRHSGPLGRKSTAILAGLGLAVPILAIMIPLLIFSDAAFEGLMDQLPEFSFGELFMTVIFGGLLACLLFSQGVSLIHYDETTPQQEKQPKGLATLTVNTVLSAVCAVYTVYLLSQLAYFSGGFSGILPEGYTLAQYARRGFFEIAWLCAINLSIIALSLALNRQKEARSTKFLCLFIALMTEFLVITASAKMFLYIGSFGLTRLRVLTQVILLFLALTTGLVAARLFVPKLSYMKTVVLAGLLLGALVSWVDVSSFVARYNVDAYLSGKLETVDVSHLDSLGSGAVPHIYRLSQEAEDRKVAQMAANVIDHSYAHTADDFREWNYADQSAAQYLKQYEETDRHEEADYR